MVLNNSFVNAGWNIMIKSVEEVEDRNWLIHYIVTKKSLKVFERKVKILPAFVNISRKNTDKEFLVYKKELTLFCNYNSLYKKVLATLEAEIMPLVLFDSKEEMNSKPNYKWKNIIDWMEKVCV